MAAFKDVEAVLRTLTLVLCGIPSCPSFAGSVTSQTPKSPLVIGVASLFQPSADVFCQLRTEVKQLVRSPTEIAYEVRPQSVGSPFPVCNVSVLVHHEAKLFSPSAELVQATFCIVDCLDPSLSVTVSAPERIFEGSQPWIELDNT